jgi:hypothetical protein
MAKFITYFTDNSSMGDNPAAEWKIFRAWAKARIVEAYPSHEVRVSSTPSVHTVHTDDEENRDEIDRFCALVWRNYRPGIDGCAEHAKRD